jgi:hypothetical protein
MSKRAEHESRQLYQSTLAIRSGFSCAPPAWVDTVSVVRVFNLFWAAVQYGLGTAAVPLTWRR